MDAIIQSSADSIYTDLPKKMTFLNKNAKISYQDMILEADYISINNQSGIVFARGKLDKNGKLISPAKVTQAGKSYETDSFNFNIKTKKAIAYNARTEEQGGVIVSEKTKKVSDSILYFKKGRYTTDEYFLQKKDTLADYYLLAPDIKLVKKKKSSLIITGPIQMYIEKVPTPLIMPFAILPFSEKRSAGILIPSFGERETDGFFLNGLGYYQPIGEHFDLKVLTDIYTKGSWAVRTEVNYRKNYKYSGRFSGEISSTLRGIKGLDDYSKVNNYSIQWLHTQDAKANPFFNFSASVNIVNSSNFYTNSLNNQHIYNGNNLNTQQNSSISFTKRFLNLPITITGSANYSQNFTTDVTNISLPQVNIAVNQFYLFKRKGGAEDGLLRNIMVQTGLNFRNDVNTTSHFLFKKEMWDEMKTGVQIPINISTNTNVLRYFTLTLSANTNNVLTTKTITKSYDAATNREVITPNRHISGYTTFGTSVSLQTILYGDKNFGNKYFVKAIRHMMTPSISFNYTPDFGDPKWGYTKQYTNARGEITAYSIFEGGVFTTPSMGLSQSLGINIGNNIQMKVRSKNDSTGVKKIKIFENLNINASYNFAKEKFRWSVISISAQNSFFNGKMNLNSHLTIDPYKIVFDGNGVGTQVEQFGFGLQGFNTQLSFPLNNETFSKKKNYAEKYKTKGEIRYENYYFDEDSYAQFEQPWTLNVNASYAYYRNSQSRFGSKTFSLGLDGNIKLTPFWTISGNAQFDLVTKKLAYTRLGFSRDQRSFMINFNWVPFGVYKVYDFYIGIKANILQDALKYKNRSFQERNPKF